MRENNNVQKRGPNNEKKYFVRRTKASRRYQSDICVNTWDLFKISGLSESEKPCEIIWNTLKGNKQKQQNVTPENQLQKYLR